MKPRYKRGAFLYLWYMPLAIGDTYEGGVIAYLLQPADSGYDPFVQHGLIATAKDISPDIRWFNDILHTTTGAIGELVGQGRDNTIAIVNNQGVAQYAARLCYLHVNDIYRDWYLPSKDELDKLFVNRETIGGFVIDYYWSSTEASTQAAYIQDFGSGKSTYDYKEVPYRVRPIRSF